MTYFALGQVWPTVPASRSFADPALGRPRASTINDAQLSSARGITLSGLNRKIPLVYGEVRTSGVYIVRPVVYLSSLIYAIAWSHGECEGVQEIYLNEQDVPLTGVTLTHYTGTDSQTVDPTLAAAVPGFADSFVGVAYTVIEIEETADVDGFARVDAVFRGIKCLDPRTDVTQWTKNPALHLYDFMTSAVYGPEMAVIGIEDVADRCDMEYESEPRCEANFNFADPLELGQMIDVFCLYAECLRSFDGANLLLVPDAPVETPDVVLTPYDMVGGSFQVRANSTLDSPTVVIANYTPSSGNSEAWVSQPARQALVGVDTGSVDEVISEVKFAGVRRLAEAQRKAQARLARLQFPGQYSWQAFDDGIRFQKGDVVQLPDLRGLVSQWVRVMDVSMVDLGIYQIDAEHYDESMYADQITPDALSGVVPVGLILPYAGDLPAGWADYTTANGKFILGAGGDVDIGPVAKIGNLVAIGYTEDGGEHSGGEPFNSKSIGVEAGLSSTDEQNDTQPGHYHTWNITTSNGEIYRRTTKLMKKEGIESSTIPEEALIFGSDDIYHLGIQRVTEHNSRYIEAGTENAYAGTFALGYAGVTTVAAGGPGGFSWLHLHNDGDFEAASMGSSGVENFIEVQNGLHTHTFSGEIIRNFRRRHLAVYGSSGQFAMRPGMIGMWDGDIEDLPDDFYLCDGSNGTLDMVDYMPVYGGADIPEPTGTNTLEFNTKTSKSGHHHKGEQVGFTPSGLVSMKSHSNTIFHDHDIEYSWPYRPACYALAFIQYLPGE